MIRLNKLYVEKLSYKIKANVSHIIKCVVKNKRLVFTTHGKVIRLIIGIIVIAKIFLYNI